MSLLDWGKDGMVGAVGGMWVVRALQARLTVITRIRFQFEIIELGHVDISIFIHDSTSRHPNFTHIFIIDPSKLLNFTKSSSHAIIGNRFIEAFSFPHLRLRPAVSSHPHQHATRPLPPAPVAPPSLHGGSRIAGTPGGCGHLGCAYGKL